MATTLRGGIVEWVEHRVTKRRAPIRLDKGRMMFWARPVDGDETVKPFSSTEGRKVRDWLMEQLARTTEADRLEWVPVIAINHERDRHGYYREEPEVKQADLSLKVERYWIALTKDEREWRKLAWAACDPRSSGCVPDNDRYSQSSEYDYGPKSDQLSYHTKPFILPSYRGSRRARESTVLPYTAELWAGLLLLIKQIKSSGKTLEDLVGSKAGMEVMMELGAGTKVLSLSDGNAKGKKA